LGSFSRINRSGIVANYLTGLMICPNKTVTGMTSEQPNASDQSCLNRFLTEVDWDAQKLNEERIRWLQNFDNMKFHERGIIALDDVLLESIVALVASTGKSTKDSGTFWDHSEKRYVHAQDLIILNVCLSCLWQGLDRIVEMFSYPAAGRRTYRGRWTDTGSVGTLHRSRLMLTAFDSPSEADRPKGRETTAMQRAALPYSLLMRELDKMLACPASGRRTSVSGWAPVPPAQ